MFSICFRVTTTHFRPIRSSKEIAGSGLTQGNLSRRIFRFGWRIHLIRRRGIDAFRCFWLTNFETLLLLFPTFFSSFEDAAGAESSWDPPALPGFPKWLRVTYRSLLSEIVRPEKSRKITPQPFLSFLYFRSSRHDAKTWHNYLTP